MGNFKSFVDGPVVQRAEFRIKSRPIGDHEQIAAVNTDAQFPHTDFFADTGRERVAQGQFPEFEEIGVEHASLQVFTTAMACIIGPDFIRHDIVFPIGSVRILDNAVADDTVVTSGQCLLVLSVFHQHGIGERVAFAAELPVE